MNHAFYCIDFKKLKNDHIISAVLISRNLAEYKPYTWWCFYFVNLMCEWSGRHYAVSWILLTTPSTLKSIQHIWKEATKLKGAGVDKRKVDDDNFVDSLNKMNFDLVSIQIMKKYLQSTLLLWLLTGKFTTKLNLLILIIFLPS